MVPVNGTIQNGHSGWLEYWKVWMSVSTTEKKCRADESGNVKVKCHSIA
jgi:hypothetical protein